MLTVISPAKSLDYDTPTGTDEYTVPTQLTQSRKLIKKLKTLSTEDISQLMKVSDNIAELNQQRYRAWKTPFKPDNARQAIFAFKGDVYLGFDAYSMTKANIKFAQAHLRILSGLYGLLRPLDLMQPYRLEMGTRLATDTGSNLYQFWGDRITQLLSAELEASSAPALINLASIEYFKSVQVPRLAAEVITPQFKEYREGKLRIIQFFAKRARGTMARFIVDEQLTEPAGLKDFNRDGYTFDPKLSDQHNWIFTREQQH